MNDLSRLADTAEIIGAAVVVVGILFALMQMRHLRQQRRELAASELFQWLAEILETLRGPEPAPAYEAHKDWKPSRLSQEI